MDRSRVEVRVGIFVFIGLTALCLMIILFGFRNMRFIKNTYSLTAVFQFTNGVVLGAPVRFAGVDVGKVEKIEFADRESNDVYLRLSIRKGIVVRKDARLIVNSLGVMGEKYLEFIPKTMTAEPYMPGEQVDGEEPLPLNDVIVEALQMVEHFRKIFEEVFDEKTKENIRATIQNLRNLTDEEVQKSLKDSLNHISLLMSSLEEVSNNLKESKGTLGLLISNPALHDSLHKTLENLNAWISGVRKNGLLYKEKTPDKERPSRSTRSFSFGKR